MNWQTEASSFIHCHPGSQSGILKKQKVRRVLYNQKYVSLSNKGQILLKEHLILQLENWQNLYSFFFLIYTEIYLGSFGYGGGKYTILLIEFLFKLL